MNRASSDIQNQNPRRVITQKSWVCRHIKTTSQHCVRQKTSSSAIWWHSIKRLVTDDHNVYSLQSWHYLLFLLRRTRKTIWPASTLSIIWWIITNRMTLKTFLQVFNLMLNLWLYRAILVVYSRVVVLSWCSAQQAAPIRSHFHFLFPHRNKKKCFIFKKTPSFQISQNCMECDKNLIKAHIERKSLRMRAAVKKWNQTDASAHTFFFMNN